MGTRVESTVRGRQGGQLSLSQQLYHRLGENPRQARSIMEFPDIVCICSVDPVPTPEVSPRGVFFFFRGGVSRCLHLVARLPTPNQGD